MGITTHRRTLDLRDREVPITKLHLDDDDDDAVCFSFTGLIADKLASYTVAFYASGGILVLGASIILFMKLTKRPNRKECDKQILLKKGSDVIVAERETVL